MNAHLTDANSPYLPTYIIALNVEYILVNVYFEPHKVKWRRGSNYSF